jgi:hypothetical protein
MTRGHDLRVLGDRAVERAVATLGMSVQTLPPELDLGPALVGAIGEAMSVTKGDLHAAGPLVQGWMTAWAKAVARPVAEALKVDHPDAVVTSLFGVEVLDVVSPSCPWAVVNSTFYVGPNAPRPLEEDFGPRAIPLIAKYVSLLGSADLVLHATDAVFDLSFEARPRPSLRRAARRLGAPKPVTRLSGRGGRPMGARVHKLADARRHPARASGPGCLEGKLVSHAAVLNRGVLLLSHAGHGSVMKALWIGRPMILVPWGRDQPGVAARAAALGVAAVVPREQASAEALSTSIDRILSDEKVREESARQGARLRSTDPPARAAELLERLL